MQSLEMAGARQWGQEAPALGLVGQSLNPSSAPVSEVVSAKSLNTSEPHVLFCKENKIYQNVLSLRFKIISYVCVYVFPRGAII